MNFLSKYTTLSIHYKNCIKYMYTHGCCVCLGHVNPGCVFFQFHYDFLVRDSSRLKSSLKTTCMTSYVNVLYLLGDCVHMVTEDVHIAEGCPESSQIIFFRFPSIILSPKDIKEGIVHPAFQCMQCQWT